jgi:hypothetical protein
MQPPESQDVTRKETTTTTTTTTTPTTTTTTQQQQTNKQTTRTNNNPIVPMERMSVAKRPQVVGFLAAIRVQSRRYLPSETKQDENKTMEHNTNKTKP